MSNAVEALDEAVGIIRHGLDAAEPFERIFGRVVELRNRHRDEAARTTTTIVFPGGPGTHFMTGSFGGGIVVPADDGLDALSVKELKAKAAELGVDVAKNAKKADLVAVVRAASASAAEPEEPTEPDVTGDGETKADADGSDPDATAAETGTTEA
ncbi:MAG TPA: hypothetical protein VMV41_09720 [Cellulomonadaceae bacterium]|nr:hypothetical protein [Cellulomonadaceae bacterium]